jgi:hypothetical protein
MLGPTGWALTPAYDMNPDPRTAQDRVRQAFRVAAAGRSTPR